MLHVANTRVGCTLYVACACHSTYLAVQREVRLQLRRVQCVGRQSTHLCLPEYVSTRWVGHCDERYTPLAELRSRCCADTLAEHSLTRGSAAALTLSGSSRWPA